MREARRVTAQGLAQEARRQTEEMIAMLQRLQQDNASLRSELEAQELHLRRALDGRSYSGPWTAPVSTAPSVSQFPPFEISLPKFCHGGSLCDTYHVSFGPLLRLSSICAYLRAS